MFWEEFLILWRFKLKLWRFFGEIIGALFGQKSGASWFRTIDHFGPLLSTLLPGWLSVSNIFSLYVIYIFEIILFPNQDYFFGKHC